MSDELYLNNILAWTSAHAEGWMEGHPGGWLTYEPDEQRALTEAALASVPINGLIVEIGCYSGLSTSLLLQVAELRDARIILVDPFYWVPGYAEPAMRKLLSNFPDVEWRLYPTTSERAYQCVLNHNDSWMQGQSIDFIHIDGDHSREGVELDTRLWLPHLKSGAVAAFHDYNGHELARGIVETVDHVTEGWEQLALVGRNGCMIRRKP